MAHLPPSCLFKEKHNRRQLIRNKAIDQSFVACLTVSVTTGPINNFLVSYKPWACLKRLKRYKVLYLLQKTALATRRGGSGRGILTVIEDGSTGA